MAINNLDEFISKINNMRLDELVEYHNHLNEEKNRLLQNNSYDETNYLKVQEQIEKLVDYMIEKYPNEIKDMPQFQNDIHDARIRSEWAGIKASMSQCAECKNYEGDLRCKIYGEIESSILVNERPCSKREEKVVAENQIDEEENSFDYINKKVEKLTKELAEAYRDNNQELITELQNKIKEATDNQLKKDVDQLVKKDLKNEKQYIKQHLDKAKIKEQQKVIDDINKRIVANLLETWSMSTPEFKTLKQELSIAISKMECYKNGLYDEKEIERVYSDNKLLEQEILGKASYINREKLLNKLGYLYNYRDKRNNYLTEKDFILDELKTIKDELLSNEGVEISYMPCTRSQYCINEFIYYLERNQVNDCLMDIYEVIQSDKDMNYNNHFNEGYKYSVYIGNEEKSIILSMVNRLEAHLNNLENQLSTKKLFEKAKKDFNNLVEIEYGSNKYLSLPLPVSCNKLKSLILMSPLTEEGEIYNCGYIYIDTISGNIEYEIETEKLLSKDPKLNLLNFKPKTQIAINSKEEYYSLYNKYFKLLDDLILMFYSKKTLPDNPNKIEEFLNIYRNIASESEQIDYALNNEFLSWCLISLPNQKIEKLNFEKSNVIINETYIDENGNEKDRERTVKLPVFPITDLSKIAERVCNEIKKLPEGTEFTIQQFLGNFEVEEKDKFSICKYIFDLCKNNNIVIVEKMPEADLGLPWNIPRIKK